MVKHRHILQQQMHAKASITSDQLAASTLDLCRLLKVRARARAQRARTRSTAVGAALMAIHARYCWSRPGHAASKRPSAHRPMHSRGSLRRCVGRRICHPCPRGRWGITSVRSLCLRGAQMADLICTTPSDVRGPCLPGCVAHRRSPLQPAAWCSCRTSARWACCSSSST